MHAELTKNGRSVLVLRHPQDGRRIRSDYGSVDLGCGSSFRITTKVVVRLADPPTLVELRVLYRMSSSMVASGIERYSRTTREGRSEAC
jgi:hypothetical protein